MKKILGFVLLCFLVNATYAQPSVKTKKLSAMSPLIKIQAQAQAVARC